MSSPMMVDSSAKRADIVNIDCVLRNAVSSIYSVPTRAKESAER
jgi:hypothetical protein